TSRGAVQGGKELIAAARDGYSLAYTVDGPRGPAYQVKSGVIRLAALAELPIIPLVCRGASNWFVSTWDRFMFSRWGTSQFYMFGDPISVPLEITDGQVEALRLELQTKMSGMRSYLKQFWRGEHKTSDRDP